MKYLVMTREHGLLPVAQRLITEGHDVEAIVDKERFEGAWGGKLHKVLRNSKGQFSAANLEPVAKSAAKGETVVLTDMRQAKRAVTIFQGAPYFYRTEDSEFHGCGLAIGGWWNGAEAQAMHLLVYDLGTWPAGLGPSLPGGLTLIRIDFTGEQLQLVKSDLEAKLAEAGEFRGLFNVGLLPDDPDKNGTFKLGGAQLGWPYLQTQAFLSELEKLGDVLVGTHEPVLPQKFVTVVPVSMPPWPCGGSNAKSVEVPRLPPALEGAVFWHDITIDVENRTISTGGLDGFVSVHRGAGAYPETARGKALAGATAIRLPEKQYRPDVGASVSTVLAQLEHLFGIVV